MQKPFILAAVMGLLLACLTLPAGAKKDPFPWLGRRPAREPVYPEILVDSGWVKEHLADTGLVLLDVRPLERYEAGHLPGARHLVLDAAFVAAATQNRPEDLAPLLGALGLSGAEELVLYGDEMSYAELGQLFWILDWAGCGRLRVLNGGATAWALTGGALSRETSAAPRRDFGAAPVDSLRIDADWIDERYGQTEQCELVDLRDEGLWDRFDTAPPYIPGHIPHSLPYDFGKLLPGDGSWPDPATARNTFSFLGPRERDYVDLDAVFALYGEDGADPRPGLGYLLLRMMDIRARVFCGGWAAWSAREDLPRVRIINAAALKSMIERGNPELADLPSPDFALFDLRGDTDHALRHLPGALSMPSHLLPDSLETLFSERWPQAERATFPLVFYCYGLDCTRSRIGATRSGHMGFRRLFIFHGGIAEWQAAELPVYGHPVESYVPRFLVKKPPDPRRG